MKTKHLRFGQGFRVMIGNGQAQAAQMTLAPGASEGGSDNNHQGADQWLFVVSGKGAAVVNRKIYPLEAGTLLLIERGERHEIRNTGRGVLKTLNVYVPPAYSPEGDELAAGKASPH